MSIEDRVYEQIMSCILHHNAAEVLSLLNDRVIKNSYQESVRYPVVDNVDVPITDIIDFNIFFPLREYIEQYNYER